MRLRIGIRIPFLPNAGVFARDLNEGDAARATEALATLAILGFADGRRIGIVPLGPQSNSSRGRRVAKR